MREVVYIEDIIKEQEIAKAINSELEIRALSGAKPPKAKTTNKLFKKQNKPIKTTAITKCFIGLNHSNLLLNGS